MDKSLPTGPRGRMLASALTIAVLASLWFGVASPLIAWHAERQDALERQIALERRMAELADTLPELQRQAEARSTHGAPAPSVIEGSTDAIAGANLQGLVQDMAHRVGASLVSVETLPGEQRGPYRRIGLHVSINAPWPVLVKLMQSVEEASPRMLIDDLELHGLPLRARTTSLPIDAAMTILAFRSTAPVTVQQ